MAAGDIQINAILLPIPGLRFTPGYIDFEVRDRTIDKTLVSDFVTIKHSFNIGWDYPVSGVFMADMVTLYLAKADVTLTVTNSDLTTTVYTCSLDISKEHLREIASGSYAFSGFTLMLEEV
jgi:hypothetical protein